MYKKYGSNLFKNRLRVCESYYKKVMNENIVRYNREMRCKMKNMREKNPEEFWKLFRKKGKKENVNIPLEELFEFIKDMNKDKSNENVFNVQNDVYDEQNVTLNCKITKDEIKKAIQKAKNDKSPGDDCIINEYIAGAFDVMSDIFVLLFNLIFETGHVPEVWAIGIVIPIYKNKGDRLQPKNYRPVTLLSCLGKIFTSILNMRLNAVIKENLLLHQNQAGFRSGYSTNDHVFCLYGLFEL